MDPMNAVKIGAIAAVLLLMMSSNKSVMQALKTRSGLIGMFGALCYFVCIAGLIWVMIGFLRDL